MAVLIRSHSFGQADDAAFDTASLCMAYIHNLACREPIFNPMAPQSKTRSSTSSEPAPSAQRYGDMSSTHSYVCVIRVYIPASFFLRTRRDSSRTTLGGHAEHKITKKKDADLSSSQPHGQRHAEKSSTYDKMYVFLRNESGEYAYFVVLSSPGPGSQPPLSGVNHLGPRASYSKDVTIQESRNQSPSVHPRDQERTMPFTASTQSVTSVPVLQAAKGKAPHTIGLTESR